VTAIVLLIILIPFKISGDESTSSQTTDYNTKPLYWAITNAGNDKNGWLNRTDELKKALVFFTTKYGGNYELLYKCIVNESSWNENAKNPHSTASGISQFINSTWNENCEGDKHNGFDQLDCMVRMWSEGKQSQWECLKKLN
jgi:hypothetical protein